jgi:putative FmdB family regulatory protein
MPIYAYRCTVCGHAQDVLQKISDPVLTVCPACGAASYAKQLTAAGFQLKGSGWYVTDFRGGSTAAAAKEGAGDGGGDAAKEGAKDAAAAKPGEKGADATAAKAPAAAAAKPDAAKPASAAPAPASPAAPKATG